jgi:hypothetical protein
MRPLVILDRYAWDSDIGDVGAWLHNIDQGVRAALAAYEVARTRFLTAARDDLGRR